MHEKNLWQNCHPLILASKAHCSEFTVINPLKKIAIGPVWSTFIVLKYSGLKTKQKPHSTFTQMKTRCLKQWKTCTAPAWCFHQMTDEALQCWECHLCSYTCQRTKMSETCKGVGGLIVTECSTSPTYSTHTASHTAAMIIWIIHLLTPTCFLFMKVIQLGLLQSCLTR